MGESPPPLETINKGAKRRTFLYTPHTHLPVPPHNQASPAEPQGTSDSVTSWADGSSSVPPSCPAQGRRRTAVPAKMPPAANPCAPRSEPTEPSAPSALPPRWPGADKRKVLRVTARPPTHKEAPRPRAPQPRAGSHPPAGVCASVHRNAGGGACGSPAARAGRGGESGTEGGSTTAGGPGAEVCEEGRAPRGLRGG